MKKITCVFLLLFAFIWQINAQIIEGFETDPPSGWTFMQTESDDPGFVQTSNQSNSGTYSFYHNDDNIATESTSWMISPALSVVTGDILEFYYRHNWSPTYTVENGVWISSASADPINNSGDFTLLYDLGANYSEDAWTLYSESLDAYNGQTIYIAFKYVGDFADELYIDDFYAGNPPSCIEPSGMVTSNLTTTSAELTWSTGDTETNWNIELKADSDFTPGNAEEDVADSVSGTPNYIASGLTPDTYYYIYYQADCVSDGTSTWAGPFIFYTGYCDSVPTSNDGSGIDSIVLGSSNFTIGDVTYEDLTGTTVDLSQSLLANLQITFNTSFYTYDANVWIDFNNDLVFDNTTELVFDGASQTPNPYTLDASFVMPAVPLGVYRMRIGTADFGQSTPNPCYNGSYGVTVDMSINVIEPPQCLPPSSMTTVNTAADTTVFSWSAGDIETNWNIEIADTDFTPGNGEEDIAASPSGTPSYTASGLAIDTTYYIYYQADCGAGGTSAWVGPYTFYNGYCDSVPTINDGQGISEVVLGSTTFTSGGDITYEDFTGTTVDLAELITANLQITFAHSYTYGVNVWIDFNNNLSFESPSELVYVGVSSGTPNPHTLDASFVMPSAPYGVYRMRVVTDDTPGDATNPCNSTSWGVTADFTVNIIAPPSCIPPSFLTVSNIGGTSADISWTVNNGETMWEYVVQPAGTGEPTGAGVSTTTNSFTESGLDYSTDYEVYVRADCGGGDLSTWSGPVNFTTTIQTLYDIVCDTDSPVNINYCYDNNDTTAWTFNSDNGFPIELVFNSGNIEGFWDDITIYDGADNSAPVLFNNNDDDQDDLAGLVIETTGSSLYIEIDSDSSASCQSSSFYTPWDFDVICKTCLDPEASFNVIGECDTTQEFTIEVDITDLGTATSLIVSDGTSNQTATTTGVVTFGPYPAQTPTVITITNADDTSCEIASGVLNLICPPPPNPCSIIYAGEDTSVCEGASINLSADYQVLGQDLNTYEINVLDSCPQPPASGGEPTSIEIDDRWSGVIDLGFDFCFFDGTYNQILIGSNGVVSFDLSNADGFNGWNIDVGDTLPNNTNPSLADANIFGVAHDIDPSVCGDINYYLLGSAPSRQFVINYTDVCHFSCNELTSSSQIILYESSNAIDVNIFNKPTCATWNDGNAVVGVQNPAGTIAFTPPGRNTGVWEATNEFWRFTPSSGAPNFVVEWYDGDTLIASGDTANVSPTETTTYTAAITYNLCTGGSSTITDEVTIEIFDNPEPVAVQDTIIICEGIEATLEVNVENSDIPDTLVYYWTYDGVDIQSGPENTYTIPEGTSQFGDFIVTAIDGNGCFGDTIISVIQGEYPVVAPVEPVVNKCINEDAILEVSVSNLNALYGNAIYEWYLDGTLLQSGTDNTYTHGVGAPEGIVTVAVYDDITQCLTETQITVAYYENENCVDIPQGLSPNNDGYNDCLILDHLEDRDDISKAIVFNRYGTKVYELNDYVDQWCGTNQDGEVLPVGTYFYIIYFNSPREPITSWIYLNY